MSLVGFPIIAQESIGLYRGLPLLPIGPQSNPEINGQGWGLGKKSFLSSSVLKSIQLALRAVKALQLGTRTNSVPVRWVSPHIPPRKVAKGVCPQTSAGGVGDLRWKRAKLLVGKRLMCA